MASRQSSSRKWQCIFFGEQPFQKDLRAWWSDEGQSELPMSAFIRLFREEHCQTVNPHGSGDCPYNKEACAKAYLWCAQTASIIGGWDIERIKGAFAIEARRLGAQRSDERPRYARDTPRRDDEGSELRRPLARPTRIGTLLGSPDSGPRQGPAENGKEGTI